jgi:hypothetical protein
MGTGRCGKGAESGKATRTGKVACAYGSGLHKSTTKSLLALDLMEWLYKYSLSGRTNDGCLYPEIRMLGEGANEKMAS